MAMRYVLVEGDPLVGMTGIILPVGRSSPALMDIPVAFIGDMVQCFICGDVKPIEKDGGPYRLGIFNGEIDITDSACVMKPSFEFAYENDVIICKCGKKPLQALLARVKQAKDEEASPMIYQQPVFNLPQGWSIAGRVFDFDPNPLSLAAMGADDVGGLGKGMTTASPWNRHLGGSFRLTNGVNAAAGRALSIRYYPTGWSGGSRARITTYGMGNVVGKLGGGASLVVGGFQIREGWEQDGGTYGKNAQVATGNVVGGVAGGAAGAKAGAAAGAAIGVWFGGAGAVPGAIIGGIIGGVGGGWLGGNAGAETVRQGQNIYNKANPNNL